MRQINESYLRTLISKSAFLRMFNSVEHLKMTAPIGATFVAGVHLYINIPLCVTNSIRLNIAWIPKHVIYVPNEMCQFIVIR